MRDMKWVLALGTVAVILGGVGGNAQARETLIGKRHGTLQVTDQHGKALPDQFYTLWIRSTKPRSVAGKSVDDPPVPCVGRLTALGASGGWTRFVDHNYRVPLPVPTATASRCGSRATVALSTRAGRPRGSTRRASSSASARQYAGH